MMKVIDTPTVTKAALVFAVGIAASLLLDHLSPNPPAAFCYSSRARKLTWAEKFPLMPSYGNWVRAHSIYIDHYVFDVDMPMCRYDGERGCWVPMTSEEHPCSAEEIARFRGAP